MDSRSGGRGGQGVMTLVAGLIVGIFAGVLLWLTTGSFFLGLFIGAFLGIVISIRNIKPVGSDGRWWPRI